MEHLYQSKTEIKNQITILKNIIKDNDTEYNNYLLNQKKLELSELTLRIFRKHKVDFQRLSERLFEEAVKDMLMFIAIQDVNFEKNKSFIKKNKDLKMFTTAIEDEERMEQLEDNALWIMDPYYGGESRITFDQCCEACEVDAWSIRGIFKKIWKHSICDKVSYFSNYNVYVGFLRSEKKGSVNAAIAQQQESFIIG